MTKAQKKKTLGLAITSLVFGCLFFIPFLGFLFSLAAIVLGIVALVSMSKSKKTIKGQGLAITGIVLGSIGVIDPVESKWWYLAQSLNSPVVAVLGQHTQAGGYPVYAKPKEIGQVYTGISGLLNLLCIINAVYLAYLRRFQISGE